MTAAAQAPMSPGGPTSFQVEDVLEWFVDHGRTTDSLMSACNWVGGDNAPLLIYDLWEMGDWWVQIGEVISYVWSTAEYPERSLDQETWVELFESAGYQRDGQGAELPTEGLTLYRGATAEGRYGMSWTSDLEVAEKFARGGLRGRETGTVWMAEIEPEYLLTYIGGESTRGESEYVVDTTGLKSLRELGAPAPRSESQCHICDDRARVWSAPTHRTILNIDGEDTELDLVGWCAYDAWHKDEE